MKITCDRRMDRQLATGCASAENDGKRGRNSAKQTSLAAGTRYKLPEVQGLVPSFHGENRQQKERSSLSQQLSLL